MATRYWVGGAVAVAEVATIQITAYDAATTYSLVINGETICSTVAAGADTTTATNLVAAFTASTHPYKASLITVANSGSVTMTFTSAVAGVPFTVSGAVSGGTGTIGAFTITTANKGPCDVSTAANWSGATLPVGGDDVVISGNAYYMAYQLDTFAGVTFASLTIQKSYTGLIGLDYARFANTAAATGYLTTRGEYRQKYFQCGATLVSIGTNFDSGSPSGSGRIMLDIIGASTITVFDSGSQSETGRSAVRLKNNSASTVVDVRKCPGGWCIAGDVPGETSTVLSATVSDAPTSTKGVLGSGLTITTFSQNGGTNTLQCAATTVIANSGVLTTEGSGAITTLTANSDATVYPNSTGTITTLNLNSAATVDMTHSNRARTITTLVPAIGGIFLADGNFVTVTNKTLPSRPYQLVLSEVS